MHVELIVHLPGLYDDQLIFFPAWGLPQGNILPFSSIYSSPVWNDVPICSMCAWISAAEVHLNLSHTHTQTHIPGNDFKDSGECGPADTPVLTLRSSPLLTHPPPQPQLHVPLQPTTSVSCFWGPLMHPQTPTRAEALQHAGANQVLTWSSYVL